MQRVQNMCTGNYENQPLRLEIFARQQLHIQADSINFLLVFLAAKDDR